jgi:hypothetical protein
MAETSDQIRNVLERIRDDAQKALNLLGSFKAWRQHGLKAFRMSVDGNPVNDIG